MSKPRRRRSKVLYKDKPPALRLVVVKGVSGSELGENQVPAVVLHLNDARTNEPCDIAMPAAQVESLVKVLSSLVPTE